jgi:ribonuclease D
MQYLHDHRALVRFVDDVAGCRTLAVDTEFVREGAYRPRLALVQIAAPGDRLAVIDPFAAAPLDPLYELLRDRGMVKILHAARQDLEIFYTRTGSVPGPVFDTQVAAAFLGYGERIGLAALLKEELGVELDKSETYTDWLARPLSSAQITYAAEDVRNLLALAERLEAGLEARARRAWVDEVLEAVTDPAQFDTDPALAYRQVRRTSGLEPRELAVLRELAAWRELEAERRDRPRRAVATDECLVELARRQPLRAAVVAKSRGLGRGSRHESAEAIVEAIKRGRRAPAGELPAPFVPEEPDPEAQAAADVVLAVVRDRARAVEVATPYVTNPGDVLELVKAVREGAPPPDIPLLGGWRAEVAGRRVLELLSGEIAISVAGGRLAMNERTGP